MLRDAAGATTMLKETVLGIPSKARGSLKTIVTTLSYPASLAWLDSTFTMSKAVSVTSSENVTKESSGIGWPRAAANVLPRYCIWSSDEERVPKESVAKEKPLTKSSGLAV